MCVTSRLGIYTAKIYQLLKVFVIAGFSVNIGHLQFALVFIKRIFVFFSCFSIILVRLRLLS